MGLTLAISGLEVESERRRVEAEALAELVRQGATDPDTEHAVGVVTETACRLLGADYAGVALMGDDGTRSWRGVWGNISDGWRSTARLQGRGPVARSINERRTIVSEHLRQNADFDLANLPLHEREGGRSALTTPLFSRDGVLGALVLGWRSDFSPADRHVRLAEALASYAATVIDNAKTHERLKQLNEDLEQRVIERTSELEAANKELEAFSYSVSHDLRAPLRSIDGFSQALLEEYGELLEGDGKDYLTRVLAATRRMAQLIDDLLTLARVARHAMLRETVNLTALAESIAANLQMMQPERDVRWNIQPDIETNGDAHLMGIVLENLLGNAWKFTSKREAATITFGRNGAHSEAIYFVRDDGAGFDMTYADKMFAPFQRLHTPAEFDGTGIGLATVQRIIHRHGGRVWAEGAPDQGATIYFSLL